jgi:diaminohydroxyphosphoribosylaminopyrimidine deaminase / 5-amino-6-(5-phosphoribosylamino)uracil reductase
MTGAEDIKFMRRCIDLASNAGSTAYPNPMVGSVIVNEGIIIGEGFHRKAGEPHAEVNAINSVLNKEMLKTSTLYVNLEPCSHFGKTPPCAEFIVANLIPKVVVGTIDTSAKVSGQGLSLLKKAGCEVITGVIQDECRWLNRRFFSFHEKHRPYIILKWAQSADGYLDIVRTKNFARKPTWITGKAEKVLVHKWRASEQSILVGAGTVRSDNPMLNVREWTGNNPLRLILSSSGIIDDDMAVSDPDGPVIIFTHNENSGYKNARKVTLSRDPSAGQICEYLYQKGIQSLFIEGGAEVLNHFYSLDLWDEARIFTGLVNFRSGIKAPRIHGRLLSHIWFSQSSLEIFTNAESQMYNIDNINNSCRFD